MSKSFTQAPKPKQLSAEVIAAFERTGPGQDTLNPTNVGLGDTPAPAPKEKMRRLSVDLPANLHRRFKIACARSDMSMLEEVARFIWKRTEELEQG